MPLILTRSNSNSNNVKYIFLTNGGGVSEAKKAEQLSKKFGVPISPDRIVLSHSPMRSLLPKYRDANVLVIGGKKSSCRQVAEEYGFKHIVTPEEVHAAYPSVCPISYCEDRPSPLAEEQLRDVHRPIDAVMVFHDSVDWGRDLQVALDALVSKGGSLGTIKDSQDLKTTKQSVPIYFSNPDIVWSNEYPVPRFGQGTFKMCLERIFKHLTGQDLEYTTFGKPIKTTYEYADSVLDKLAPLEREPSGRLPKRTVYAIGDNPYADIAGANSHGWESLLVKTGVFRTKNNENHHIHPATAVVDHVEDAVRWILTKEMAKE
ncbi:hypothetical protein BGW38_001456 [Lunasporangiospora selenospora]|uniref:Uncharacterized protein n=1 Tax=Lunasporangiospora selenospora TaxID=979761 RepID=A0A9P6G186_9FUNG|nr:hypothetical protein BGW38_001456 [Lunasporangiospora selenospora]